MVKLTSKSATDTVISVPAGEFIYREGDAPGEMFFVQEGVVELIRRTGGHDAVIAALNAGEFFGEGSLLEPQPRDASAKATTACRLVKLDGPELREMLKSDPEIALSMIRRLSRRLAAALVARTEPAAPPRAPHMAAGPATPAAKRAWRPRFVHASGGEFPLPPSGDAVVGRADPVKGYTPDVVFSSLDEQRSLSRRHARVVRRGDEFFVVEEPGVHNGTFVNGKALKAGQPHEIDDGDEVAFGLIKTVFRLE